MTRLTLLRYGAYAKCSQDSMPLHILGGEQIRSIADQLQSVLTGLDKDDVTFVASQFRPARESVEYILSKILYPNEKKSSYEMYHLIKGKVQKLPHWTLPNHKLSDTNIKDYMDFEAYIKNHKEYDQQILDDIANCKTQDMICGVHGRTMNLILESMNLKDTAQLEYSNDGRDAYSKPRNAQAVVIDTAKNEVIKTLVPHINSTLYF